MRWGDVDKSTWIWVFRSYSISYCHFQVHEHLQSPANFTPVANDQDLPSEVRGCLEVLALPSVLSRVTVEDEVTLCEEAENIPCTPQTPRTPCSLTDFDNRTTSDAPRSKRRKKRKCIALRKGREKKRKLQFQVISLFFVQWCIYMVWRITLQLTENLLLMASHFFFLCHLQS